MQGWAAPNAYAFHFVVSMHILSEAACNTLACVTCMQGTATMGKGITSRNDQFTKLMGDVNKQQHLL